MISVTRFLRLGVRVAAWATPRVQEWHRARHRNRVEGERHLHARNWSEAEKHLKLALDEGHHSTARRLDILLGLTEAQRKIGRSAEAEQTTQTAIALAASSKNKALQSRALDGLVDIQLDQKKYAEVEQTIAQIEALERALPQPDFQRLASTSRKLGTALLNNGCPEEAMEAFERAGKLAEKAFGPDHVETANVLTELGAQYRAQGDHVQAQRCLQRALEIHRKTSGADSHAASQDLFHLASSLEESGDLDGAASQYEKALAVAERQIGGDREQMAVTQAHLAAIYVRAGRTSAARELLIHSLGLLERKKGDERLEFALETMACVEEALYRPLDAIAWRDKAAASRAIRTGEDPQQTPDPAKKIPIYY
jgi:tetratricopeptide (TPR) repeat protein